MESLRRRLPADLLRLVQRGGREEPEEYPRHPYRTPRSIVSSRSPGTPPLGDRIIFESSWLACLQIGELEPKLHSWLDPRAALRFD
ncbi:Hypp438 [Branchiostoma lanceolatum]|uniref:Hypp438 protein n=1 Tax=Branchiostoma lanceolatum TaxID=7740 RepID=A0A8J9VB23_BRALA|nr:Hypp438 [Branchiostoma lanceolatum]